MRRPIQQQNITKILKKEETNNLNIKKGINTNNDWLQQFVDSNRLILLLLPTCLLSLALISFILFICCRYCQRNKNNNQQKNKQRIKNKRNFGGGTTTYSGSFTRGTIEFPSQNRNRQTPDPACNPLVPRKTTASQVIADQQPPPPRPPRYRRDTHGTAALPTVEVKPMHRVQQNKPTTTITDNISLKSNQTIQSNQLNEPSSIPKIRRTSASTGAIQKRRKKENILNVPEPPPRHSSGDLVKELEINTNSNAQLLLRSFGLPLDPEELNNNKEIIQEEEEKDNNNYSQKIEKACNIAINNKKQKLLINNNSDSFVGTSTNTSSPSSDYLTMKPVHRAKPFLSNKLDEESLPPPPPPQHRTTTAKLYDCPIETNIDSDENEEK
ncbi:hypothetical protein ACQ4LE_006236 [Meloidogyne hapla]